MEENNKKDDTNKNADTVDPVAPITPILEHESKSDKDAAENRNNTDSNQHEAFGHSVLFTSANNNKWSISDKLSLAQTVINFIMTVATLALLFFAFQQISEARKSNTISENNYKIAKEALDKGEIESRKRYKLDSINMQSQIEALKNQVSIQKKQFDIENEPLFNIGEIKAFELNPDKPVTLVYNLTNIGRFPGKLIYCRLSHSVDTKHQTIPAIVDDLYGITKSEIEEYETNSYISNSPVEITNKFTETISESTFNYIISGDNILYIAIAIKYENVINLKQKSYFLLYRYEPSTKQFTTVYSTRN